MRSTCVGWKAFLLSVPNVLPIRSVCDNHWTPRRAITRSVHISTDGQIRPRNWYRNILLKNQLVLFIDYDLAQISDDILHASRQAKGESGSGSDSYVKEMLQKNAPHVLFAIFFSGSWRTISIVSAERKDHLFGLW